MAVEKMKLLTVIGTKESREDLVEKCCMDGHVHTEGAMQHLTESDKFKPLIEENKASEQLNLINNIANILNIKLDYSECDGVSDEQFGKDCEYLEKLSGEMTQLKARHKEIDGEIGSLKAERESLSHFTQMDLPLNEIIDCKFLKFRFGCMPKQSLQKLSIVEEKYPEFFFLKCSEDDDKVWGVYFATLDTYKEVDELIAALDCYFERLRLPNSHFVPEKAIEEYDKKIEALQKDIDSMQSEFDCLKKDEAEKIKAVYSRLTYINAAHEISSNVVVSQDMYGSFCYMGWVPDAESKEVEENLEAVDGVDWEWDKAEDLDEKHVPPTKLKNNKLIKPYESLVKMYGVPNYREFDPTTVFGIMYTVLFGLMFADVGQGFVLALGGFLLGKLKNSDLGKVFARCGVSSMLFGVVFGSVFGFEHAMDWFWQMFGLAEKPFDILDSTLGVILMSIYIGVGLIYFFMFLNIYKCITQKRFGKALFGESGLAGMITYTGGVLAIAQFLNKDLHILPMWGCLVLIVVGLVLLFVKELMISKIDKQELEFDGAGDYIITNLVELLEYIISYFTNTLSFLRVGIFVLVHAVMMNVVFTLAPDPASNIVGFILTVVIGNIIVAALEGLLTYIQVLRLGFYEMFSRFYDGDGVEFKSVNLRKKHKAKN